MFLFFLFLLLPHFTLSNTIILSQNKTLLSQNQTFQLGLFNLEQQNQLQPRYYLSIRFTSLPSPNIIWVANRNKPISSLTGSALQLTRTGQLLLTQNDTVLWQTKNTLESPLPQLNLLENGNLVLETKNGVVLWQTFDEPTDTWLPGMNLTRVHNLLSWRTLTNPDNGFYSLRLKPPNYGEFELVFNGTVSYWDTGKWTGGAFTGVPEMTVPIYRFDFEDAYSPMASFGFSERALENGVRPPTMFRVEPFGQMRQYTWSSQAGSWNMFWSRPESICSVKGVAVTLVVLAKRKRLKKENGLEEDGFVPVLNLKVFSYKELQLATRGFSEKLGHGGFGTVFQGELSDSTVVAVKRLERPGGGEKEFRAEVSTIGNIQHVNLVRLRGFCSENAHRLLVYEYMPNGALSAYLRKEGPCLSWDVRLRVAIGTAKGIAYLHEECRSCIIHCDIKPENILLDSDFTAKVSDFGLAKLIGRDFSRVLATRRGTLGYVAPEWISGVEITTKADVYSYGMTLLELVGGRRNVEAPPSSGDRKSDCETGDKWFFPPWAAQLIIDDNVAAVVDKKLGNVYNIEEAKRVALVAVWCIQDDEAMRPTMSMVVKMLEGLVEVALPPPPKLLQALVTGESFHGVKVDSSNAVSTAGSSSFCDNMEVSVADSESCIGEVFSPPDGIVNVR